MVLAINVNSKGIEGSVLERSERNFFLKSHAFLGQSHSFLEKVSRML